jgi:hypothetical protein
MFIRILPTSSSAPAEYVHTACICESNYVHESKSCPSNLKGHISLEPLYKSTSKDLNLCQLCSWMPPALFQSMIHDLHLSLHRIGSSRFHIRRPMIKLRPALSNLGYLSQVCIPTCQRSWLARRIARPWNLRFAPHA